MKQSQRLEKEYNHLRGRLISEIMLLIKQHQDIEIEPEFKKPIAYAVGYDEQDEHQLIEEVNENFVTVFHQGNEVETVGYGNLSTEILLNLLKGMEESLEEAKKFISK
jgi:hypothetical protein